MPLIDETKQRVIYEEFERRVWRDMKSKYLSRKFLMSVAGIIITIAVGLGYDINAELVTAIAGGIAALYIIVEGGIDKAKK